MEHERPSPRISLIVPVYNEEENVRLLLEKIYEVLAGMETPFEVVVVDDGSRDRTLPILHECVEAYPHLRVVALRRNFGQTAALAAAIHHSSGDILIPLDGDLQNDPSDIPILLAKLEEGYDVVSGWRKGRKDAFLTRTLPSKIANAVISLISGVHLHDYGCTLKAYRREVLEPVRLLGEMHRFIPILASWQGARVTEVPVRHHARERGKSKYGLGRTFKVILDLITVKFLVSFITKPIYVFGGTGGLLVFLSGVLALYTLYQKFAFKAYVHRNPLFVIAVFFGLAGLQFLLMGLLGELLIRIYFDRTERTPYVVKEIRDSAP